MFYSIHSHSQETFLITLKKLDFMTFKVNPDLQSFHLFQFKVMRSPQHAIFYHMLVQTSVVRITSRRVTESLTDEFVMEGDTQY